MSDLITFVIDQYIIDPLGISYLSSILKKNGYGVRLVLTSNVKKIETPIVGFSVTTGKHNYYANINRLIKEENPKTVSIFGGPHCTFEPEFAKESGVDYIFRGECFHAITEFAQKFLEKEDTTTTHNLAFRRSNEIICNPLLPPVNPDEIPFPDRELIYQFKRNRTNPIRNVMASFYCPMRCSYCFNKQFKELGYRPKIRAVENIIEECSQLENNYPTQLIYFQDDIFPVYSEEWLELFCNEYRKRINAKFHIQIRIEMLDEDKIRMLKNAGLHGATFAIETADERARLQLLNRKISNRTIIEKANLLSKYGIKFRIENMLGIPFETLQSALRTLDLNLQCHPDVGWASLFTPYYGTDLGDFCRENNLIETDYKNDFFTNSPLKLKDKSRIERLQKLFGLTCYLPSIRHVIPILVSLPLNYRLLSELIKQWLYKRRLFKV